MELASSKMQKQYKLKDIKNAIKLNSDPAAYAELKDWWLLKLNLAAGKVWQ